MFVRLTSERLYERLEIELNEYERCQEREYNSKERRLSLWWLDVTGGKFGGWRKGSSDDLMGQLP